MATTETRVRPLTEIFPDAKDRDIAIALLSNTPRKLDKELLSVNEATDILYHARLGERYTNFAHCSDIFEKLNEEGYIELRVGRGRNLAYSIA